MSTSRIRGSYNVGRLRIAIVREGTDAYPSPRVESPTAAAELFKTSPDDGREHFRVLFLSARHIPIGVHTVSIGCLTASLVHPREVFRPAILSGSVGIVITHNHPSGDPEPSAEDLALTRRLAAAGSLLGIEILDHVITGDGTARWVSLKDRGSCDVPGRRRPRARVIGRQSEAARPRQRSCHGGSPAKGPDGRVVWVSPLQGGLPPPFLWRGGTNHPRKEQDYGDRDTADEPLPTRAALHVPRVIERLGRSSDDDRDLNERALAKGGERILSVSRTSPKAAASGSSPRPTVRPPMLLPEEY